MITLPTQITETTRAVRGKRQGAWTGEAELQESGHVRYAQAFPGKAHEPRVRTTGKSLTVSRLTERRSTNSPERHPRSRRRRDRRRG